MSVFNDISWNDVSNELKSVWKHACDSCCWFVHEKLQEFWNTINHLHYRQILKTIFTKLNVHFHHGFFINDSISYKIYLQLVLAEIMLVRSERIYITNFYHIIK